VENQNLKVTETEFTSNKAFTDGGAIYLSCDKAGQKCLFDIEASTFKYN
jgi:predicted outer membrane repeat protein